jgi:hypothetical protein
MCGVLLYIKVKDINADVRQIASSGGTVAMLTTTEVMQLFLGLQIAPNQSSRRRDRVSAVRSQAACTLIFFPVAAMIFTRRSDETPAVAPFLTAETFERATPDRLTISLTLNPESAIALKAILEILAL